MCALTATNPAGPAEPLGPEHDPEHELWHRVAHALRDLAHPVHLGEHLIDELDHLGGRATAGEGPLTPARERQVWDWIDHLSPRRVLDRAAALGGRFLDMLDVLGNRLRDELGIREWTGPVNRVPRGTWLVAGALGTLVVLFVWTAMQGEGQGNDWMTDPGAGVAAGATPMAGMPATGNAMPMGAAAAAPAGAASPAAAPAGAASPAAAPAAAASPAGAASPAVGTAAVQSVSLAVNPPPLGGATGSDGQVHDAFVPGTFTMRTGTTVTVTVVNYDSAPHTWTSPGLGVNATIPAGTSTTPSRTTFTIHPTTAGTFSWYCALPCDPWSMTHDGYMRGTVTVTS